MKKVKVIFITILASILILISLFSSLIPLTLLLIIIFGIFYLGTYYILDFDIEEYGYTTILFIPAFIVSMISVGLVVYIPKYIGILSLGDNLNILLTTFIVFLAITFSGYAVIISMNIFNVARYKRIPLLQAAQGIVYFYTYLSGYIAFNLIHHFLFPWYLTIPLYVVIGCMLVFINNWSIRLRFSKNLLFVLLGAFLIMQVVIVLCFFPIKFYILPISITLCIYIYNGILMHLHRRLISKMVSLEYLVLSIILVLVILYFADWGVAGNLLGV